MSSILQSIKVSAAVSGSASGPGAIYTVPANSYAIIQISTDGTPSSLVVSVGGQRLTSFSSNGQVLNPIYLGPSQSVNLVSGSGIIRVSGVEFVNTA